MSSNTSNADNQSTPQALRDSSVAAGLVVVLGIVFVLDLFTVAKTPEETVKLKKVTKTPEPEPIPLKIKVTSPQFDDMGRLLTDLGSAFHFTEINDETLVDESIFSGLDILFLTCGGVPSSWVDKVLGDAERGQKSVSLKPEVVERVSENLKNFVGRGGTLYVSDERFHLVRNAFPEFINTAYFDTGTDQVVDAEVVDAGLRKMVGDRIQLRFDKRGWFPANFNEQKPHVEILVRGAFKGMGGGSHQAPLLVRFKYRDGFVIFTSFHNEKVQGEIATKLLKYLVFATVLAKTEEKTANMTTEGGFVAKGKSLLSASSTAPSVTQQYKCTKAGPLRFVLGFENRGAKLKLTVISPSGQKKEMEGTSTFVIEIPDAAVGDWQYTITAIKMPFENFPFTLNVGGK